MDLHQNDKVPITYITPQIQWIPDWAELWQSRELLFFLVWRDIKVRYKQTVIGVGWAIIQPFVTMVVFSIFFGRVLNVDSDGVPYPIFSYSALVPWMLFATALGVISQSVVANANLIRKVYFSRLLLPTSALMGKVVDFWLSFIILIGMMFVYGYYPPLSTIVIVPTLVIFIMTIALGIGLWLAALNVFFRDINQLVPFLIQLWLFATPVIYPSSMLNESDRILFSVNPMVSVIESFRWILLGTEAPSAAMFAVSASMTIVLLIGGIIFFQRMERSFTDIV